MGDRVSDNAIEIINELHTERLNYESEYLPLIDCANKCSAYEDTGLEPEEIERIRSDVESGYLKSTARRYGIDINRLRELAEADRNGLCVVLDGKSRDKELICKLMRLLYWLEDSIKKKDFSPFRIVAGAPENNYPFISAFHRIEDEYDLVCMRFGRKPFLI